MQEIANLLGVEIGESFIISTDTGYIYYDNISSHKTDNSKLPLIYSITEEGLKANCNYGYSMSILFELIKGIYHIEKLPFYPKENDVYWFVWWRYEPYIISVNNALYSKADYVSVMNNDIGNCFRSKIDAEKNKYRFYKKFTGKQWTKSEETNE